MKNGKSFSILLSFLCLSLVGLALLPLLPVKLNPSRSLPGFTVGFSLPGSSARVIEMEVTSKLESLLARVRGIRHLSSVSGNGYGRVEVELDRHAELDAVRFEVSTIIRQAWPQLPAGTTYPYLQLKVPDESSARPFLAFTLNAPATPTLIQRYAEETIKPRLAALAGVYKVEVNGATPMEWRLEYDSEQLRVQGITPDEIRSAIGQHLRKEFLGTHSVEDGRGGRQWIRLVLAPEAAERDSLFDASAIVVAARDGRLVRLDELVTVSHVEEQPQSYYRINGLNSIYLSVTAVESANQLELSRAVRHEIETLRRTLPAGYEIHQSYDTTEYIREELDKIYLRTGLTVLILFLFVWIISRQWRYLLLILSALAVNLAVAFIFYYLFGLEMQLYSLAGITISLNLMIDSTIVMADHLRHRRNLSAFLSVLAATLTTIGALSIIFFLDERLRINLQDFAAVVMVNLAVSLPVSLFFVPAMMRQTGMLDAAPVKVSRRRRHRRWAVRFSRFYLWLTGILCRHRVVVGLLVLLLFGLPVFLLPDKVEGEGRWASFYNRTLGSTFYREQMKPVVDKALGGTLRLFVQKVYEGSYFTRNEEVVLYANANLPNGSTLEQMNTLMKRMEAYLSQFSEIARFHTSIYSARRASLNIYFKKPYRNSGFPYTLKARMTAKALQLGGGSWTIYGLQDQGFSNDVREQAGSYRIRLYGYNYDELYAYAEELKARLLTRRRIKEVTINSNFSWWKDDYQEFFFQLDSRSMAESGRDARNLFGTLSPIFGRDVSAGTFTTPDGAEYIRLSSRQSEQYDVWAMQYFPHASAGEEASYKLASLAGVEKSQMPQEIAKEDQQYRLCLQYEYIGSYEMGRRVQQDELEEFCAGLPMGYTAQADNQSWGWGNQDHRQYLLLLLVVIIIFFTTAILFDSLRQPLAVICVIPVSYVGVFLTFYLFRLNFDQGGFASFVLLCGITVNASIYILNEYNNIRRRHPRLAPLRAYVKAWNAKVVPICLTVLSTILGFIPFLIGTQKEGFWFPLAAGTVGGLLMSVVGIFLLLPLWVNAARTNRRG